MFYRDTSSFGQLRRKQKQKQKQQKISSLFSRGCKLLATRKKLILQKKNTVFSIKKEVLFANACQTQKH